MSANFETSPVTYMCLRCALMWDEGHREEYDRHMKSHYHKAVADRMVVTHVDHKSKTITLRSEKDSQDD